MELGYIWLYPKKVRELQAQIDSIQKGLMTNEGRYRCRGLQMEMDHFLALEEYY